MGDMDEPAGWYSDPEDPSVERFWSGKKWMPNRRQPGTHEPIGLEFGAEAPAKKGLGCFGGCLIVVAVIVALVIGGSIIGAIVGNQSSGGNSSSGGSGSNTSSGGSGGESGSSSDPIEQAVVVLSTNFGEDYSYATVKSETDASLSMLGLPLTDEYRSRAWSAVLGSVKQPELANVSPMAVMRCVQTEGVGAAGAGLTFPDVAAICAVLLM